MGIELQAGGNIALPSATEVLIDIRWEPERPAGQDVDASAFLLGTGGKVAGDADFVFYNNPRSRCGGVRLREGSGAHRQLRINPGLLPASVAKVAVCLSLFGGGSFAQATRIAVGLADAGRSELAVFRPQTAGMPEAALILGEIYRHREQWKFRALAQGFAGGLGPLAGHFGVEIAAEEEPPPALEEPAAPAPAPAPAATGVLSLAKAPATGVLPTGSETQYSPAGDLSYELLYRGAFALARVDLPRGRELKAEAGAMVAMSPAIEVAGTMSGGLLGGIGRMVSGESLFLQTLTAKRGAGPVYLAPVAPGDIAAMEVEPGAALVIQRGGFLACTQGVEVSTKVQNIAQGLFSREGFFILKAEGQGLILLESFGAIHRIELGAGEQQVVDNGHLVAWSQSMRYDLELGNPGLVAAFSSGENIVCRFQGPGTILVQSRQPRQFGRWISQVLPR